MVWGFLWCGVSCGLGSGRMCYLVVWGLLWSGVYCCLGSGRMCYLVVCALLWSGVSCGPLLSCMISSDLWSVVSIALLNKIGYSQRDVIFCDSKNQTSFNEIGEKNKFFWHILYVFHVHKMVTYSLIYNMNFVRQT